MKHDEYEYLAGSSDPMQFMRHSLWIAGDHMLSVTHEGYMENYSRFFFKNIQAIVIRVTPAGKVWNGVFASLTAAVLALALFGLAFDWSAATTLSYAVVFGVLCVCLIVNMFRGPTCSCVVQTAVHSERLFALRRLRPALKAVNRLRPLIEAEQGSLAPEDAERYGAGAAQVAAQEAAAGEPGSAVLLPGPKRHYYGRAHLLLFSFLFLDLWHSAASFLYQGTAMTSLAVAIMIGTLVSNVVALVRQHRSDMPLGLRNVTWWCLVYFIVSIFVGIVYGIYSAAMNGEAGAEAAQAYVSPYDSPAEAALLMFSFFGSGTLAFIGLLRLNAFRKACDNPPPLPEKSGVGGG